jgi:signal peptidase II
VKLNPARRNDAIMAGVALAVIIADQLTKYWIVQYFRASGPKPPIPILGQVLQLEYTQNTGVAFSMLQGQAVLFLFVAAALGVIGWLYWRVRETAGLAIKLTFGLILGGALGNNLVDRLRQGYVVDFIHFQIPGRFDWPVFNLADSAISVGVVALAFLLWRGVPERSPAPGSPSPATGDSSSPAGGAPLPRVRNPRARAR